MCFSIHFVKASIFAEVAAVISKGNSQGNVSNNLFSSHTKHRKNMRIKRGYANLSIQQFHTWMLFEVERGKHPTLVSFQTHGVIPTLKTQAILFGVSLQKISPPGETRKKIPFGRLLLPVYEGNAAGKYTI